MVNRMQRPFLLEKKLFEHVRKYMETHPRLDVGDMTEYLIKEYREYNKKNKKKFEKSVIKAYKYELWQKGIDPKTVKLRFDRTDYKIESIKLEDGKEQKKIESFNKEAVNGEVSESDDDDDDDKNKKRKRHAKRKREEEEICDKDFYVLKRPRLNIKDIVYIREKDKFKLRCQFLPNRINCVNGPRGCGKNGFIEAFAMAKTACLLLADVKKILNDDRRINEYLDVIYRLAESRQPCFIVFQNVQYAIDWSKPDQITNKLKYLFFNIHSSHTDVSSRTKKVYTIIKFWDLSVMPSIKIKDRVDITIPMMDVEDRIRVIKSLIPENVTMSEKIIEQIADATTAYVYNDIKSLIEMIIEKEYYKKIKKPIDEYDRLTNDREKAINQFMKTKINIQENSENNDSAVGSINSIKEVLMEFKPVLISDDVASVPQVSYSDIGGMEEAKKMFEMAMESQFMNDCQFELLKNKKRLNETETSGILLWGPPGCGKTLLAKAVANDVKVNFLSVSASELVSMYQGQSEANIRRKFEAADRVKPCILFFDEIDCMCPRRTKNSQGGGSKYTMVNTFLSEMCGMKDRTGVLVVGTTNRPDRIDPALLRPGRFDTVIYIGLPNIETRVRIFNVCLKNISNYLAEDVNVQELAELTDKFSSADIDSVCTQAKCSVDKEVEEAEGMYYVEERSISSQMFSATERDYSTLPKNLFQRRHFIAALDKIKPSVSEAELKRYENLTKKINSVNVQPQKKNEDIDCDVEEPMEME